MEEKREREEVGENRMCAKVVIDGGEREKHRFRYRSANSHPIVIEATWTDASTHHVVRCTEAYGSATSFRHNETLNHYHRV